ncbi:hypothetical protein L0222_01450 [bacterium]|nr:hypothetical protein [bacterium]MCI0604198.1 hypothetical protein [bacterium]
MSFADYLRDRISSDYKNLIIQKLEEIREQTEKLKNSQTPVFDENHQKVRQAVQNELTRVQDILERELSDAQDRISASFHTLVDQHIASWYQADVTPFEQQLEVLLSDIVSNIPAPPKRKNTDLESLADLMKKIDQQHTQSEILNSLLMHIASWVGRAVLFVIKGNQASGWAALGLGNDWNTDRVRSIRLDLEKQNILNEVTSTGELSHGAADKYPDNGEIYLAIGNRFPKSVVACPITVRGKIAGILYADIEDDFAEKPDLPDLLFLATRAAGLAIDLLPLKPKTAPAPVKEAPPPAPPPVEVAPPPLPPPPVPEVEVTAPQPVVPVEPVAAVPVQEEPETVAEAVASVVAEPEIVEAEAKAEPEPEEAEGTVVMPAIAPPLVLSEEEQKLHDDAKRFARLLVSEIKLYNEAQVAAGREHRDLYERLREDIERSRQMYQNRVPTHIHTSTNYFYEELVKTLANGDATLLGM